MYKLNKRHAWCSLRNADHVEGLIIIPQRICKFAREVIPK